MKTLDGQRRSAVRLLMAVRGAVTLLSRNGAWPIRAGELDLCLHYADDDTLRLIDPHTGASQQDHQSMAWRVVLSENTQIWPRKISPDGKHRLHFVGPDATQPQPRLFVDAVDTRRLTLLHTGNLDGGYWWAPDNAYLAFTWHSDQGQGFVT